MTRADLISALAGRYPQFSLNDAKLAVKLLLDAMANTLAQEDRIEIRGFGSFTVNHRPARNGRNPKTGVDSEFGKNRTLRNERSSIGAALRVVVVTGSGVPAVLETRQSR